MSGDAMRRNAAKLRGEAETLVPRASEVVRKTAFATQGDAQALAPVETGLLQNSITTVVSNGGLTAHVIATASYAFWVENGTSRMAPQPFMGPATDRNAPLFREAMSQLGGGG